MPRQPHQLYSGIAGEGRGGGCSRTIHNTSYTHHNWSLESYHNTSTKYTGVHCTVDRTPTGRNTSSPQLQSFAMANKVSAFTYRNLKWCPLLPLFKINFLFSTPVSTLAQKEEGHIDNQTFQCQRRLPRKICHPSVVVGLLITGGCDHFLSCFNGLIFWSGRWYRLFGRGGREKQKQNKTNNNCMLCCAILTQFDLEWKRSGEIHLAQLLYPNRNETVL